MIEKLLRKNLIRFLLGGVFMKSLAFILNYLLADLLNYQPSSVYIVVLIFDFVLGYFVNRHFVFGQTKTKDGKHVLVQFFLAGVAFRVIDWIIYVNLLSRFKLYILVAQLISTAAILASKFFIYRVIFR